MQVPLLELIQLYLTLVYTLLTPNPNLLTYLSCIFLALLITLPSLPFLPSYQPSSILSTIILIISILLHLSFQVYQQVTHSSTFSLTNLY